MKIVILKLDKISLIKKSLNILLYPFVNMIEVMIPQKTTFFDVYFLPHYQRLLFRILCSHSRPPFNLFFELLNIPWRPCSFQPHLLLEHSDLPDLFDSPDINNLLLFLYEYLTYG